MGLGLQQQQLHTFSRFPGPRAHQFGLATSAAQSASGARRLTRFPKGRIVASLGESSSSKSSSFWQPFWNIGANSGTSSSSSGGGGGGLGFNGAGSGGGRNGNGDGDGNGGGRNGNGDGDGNGGGFESSGEDIYLNAAVVDIKESEDEDKPPDFRTAGLASLSSAAGEALDGEAPFGDVLLGRNHRRTVETPANSQGGASRGKDEGAATQAAQLNDGEEALARRSETATLRRLQREAFADLLRVRERLDKLEFFTGLRPSKAHSSFGDGAAKTRLKGEVNAGGAFVYLDADSSRESRAALEQAGLQTGLDVRFTFETPYREKDVMLTQCSAGSDGGPISVSKLVYNAQVTNDINLVVAPLGARGIDVTETVNPLQGQALTQFARVGPALYDHCVGSALGATLRGKTALVSMAQFISGWGCGLNSGPLCLSTLAHVLFQPWENSVFSISAVNRYWPSPPLSSFRGLHWSEMGPFVLSKSRRGYRSGSSTPQMNSPRDFRTSMDNTSIRDSRTSMDNTEFRTSMDNASLRDFSEHPSGLSASAAWGRPYDDADRGIITIPETRGSSQQSVAMAGEIDVGANMSLSGWAQADREYWLQEGENKDMEWGVSLSKAVGTTAGWGVCVGSSKVDLWSGARDEDNRYSVNEDGLGDKYDMQLHVEAYLKLNMGRGFTLQPGVLYLLNKQSQTPAFVLRSSWAL